MKYYLHDTNAFQDEKISELFIEFGYEALGLFYTILERIGAQEKPIKTEVLKKQLHVGKKLEKCWNFMESIGIISANNGETFNERILSYSETYKIKKEKNAKRISEWRNNQQDAENVTRSENVRNAPKVKRSKVNRSKDIYVDKSTPSIINNLPIEEEKFRQDLVPFVQTFGKEMIRLFFDYWREPNKSKTKMRWQQEKTWDLKLRLKRWADNQKIKPLNNSEDQQSGPPLKRLG